MRKNWKSIFALLFCFTLCFLQSVSGKDLEIGEVEFPSLRWGEQRAVVEASNFSELTKFIVVEIEIVFTGEYLSPTRNTRTSFIINPGESAVLDPVLSIPGNFGRAKVSMQIYDVIDTLDMLLPNQLAFEQPFFLNFNVTDALVPYLQDKVLYPPRVGDDIDFDNEFARLLPLLLSEGNSPGDIADMAMCDTSFVVKTIERFMEIGYAKKNDVGNYQLNFPVISMEEGDKGRALAKKTAESLADIIGGNIDDYYRVVDSLKQAGKVPKDTNLFYDGGALLYFPFPVVNCLGLWWNLAEDFITRDLSPMTIYSYSRPCEIKIPLYMYAVVGGDNNNGSQYYSSKSSIHGVMIYYGDESPQFDCVKNISNTKSKRRYSSWSIADGYEPRGFMIDTGIVKPAVDALMKDADPLIKDTYKEVTKLGLSYNRNKVTRGYYFWFWNLVATQTTKILNEKGIVPRMGNGQFKFESIAPVG